ncbi:hypothetical protein [Kitasatospora sp. MBT63]|uniref:hypothetical protein n=1 Tax=Kitasatospora sp. MBT63 TaxID=1444768 RepID=UPI000539FBB3|nr:hypothetical protein [Kitasatospora sp. MBT63]
MTVARTAEPLHPDAGPRLRALVRHLLELKRRSGVGFRELARRTEALAAPGGPADRAPSGTAVALSASTLSRAVTGAGVPSRQTVEMFARAAFASRAGTAPGPAAGSPEPYDQWVRRNSAGDPQRVREACRRWDAARVERTPRADAARYRRPHQVRTTAALGQGLSRMRAGLTYRDIENRTARLGHRVGRSTAHRLLAGLALPTCDQMAALLAVFGVTRGSDAWLRTRDRLAARGTTDEVAPGHAGPWYGCFDGHPDVQAAQDRRDNDERIKVLVNGSRPELDGYDQMLADQEENERRAREQRLLEWAEEMDHGAWTAALGAGHRG